MGALLGDSFFILSRELLVYIQQPAGVCLDLRVLQESLCDMSVTAGIKKTSHKATRNQPDFLDANSLCKAVPTLTKTVGINWETTKHGY